MGLFDSRQISYYRVLPHNGGGMVPFLPIHTSQIKDLDLVTLHWLATEVVTRFEHGNGDFRTASEWSHSPQLRHIRLHRTVLGKLY